MKRKKPEEMLKTIEAWIEQAKEIFKQNLGEELIISWDVIELSRDIPILIKFHQIPTKILYHRRGYIYLCISDMDSAMPLLISSTSSPFNFRKMPALLFLCFTLHTKLLPLLSPYITKSTYITPAKIEGKTTITISSLSSPPTTFSCTLSFPPLSTKFLNQNNWNISTHSNLPSNQYDLEKIINAMKINEV